MSDLLYNFILFLPMLYKSLEHTDCVVYVSDCTVSVPDSFGCCVVHGATVDCCVGWLLSIVSCVVLHHPV